VRQKAATIFPFASEGSHFFFCSSLPKRRRGLRPMD